jgi:competence protein ComEA
MFKKTYYKKHKTSINITIGILVVALLAVFAYFVRQASLRKNLNDEIITYESGENLGKSGEFFQSEGAGTQVDEFSSEFEEGSSEESESDESEASTISVKSKPSIVNINTATIEELDSLDGVGTKKAEAIIEYRKTHGKFSTIDDIKNVSGIGDGIFSKIKNSIKV